MPEHTNDLSLDDFLKRFFIIFIADINIEEGEVAEEEEELEDADDIKEEVDGDNLEGTLDFWLHRGDILTFDLSLPNLLLRRNSLFIAPELDLELVDAFGSLSSAPFTVMEEQDLLDSSDLDETIFEILSMTVVDVIFWRR